MVVYLELFQTKPNHTRPSYWPALAHHLSYIIKPPPDPSTWLTHLKFRSALLTWPSNLTYTPELPNLHPTSSLYPIPILFQYSLLLPVEEVALDLQIQQFENPPSQNTSGCKKLYGLNTVQCVRHHKGGWTFSQRLLVHFQRWQGVRRQWAEECANTPRHACILIFVFAQIIIQIQICLH